MYLSHIKISNFRIFENFSLELNKGLNLLVGENDSGKTALIDSIRLVLDTNSADWFRLQETDFHNQADTLSIQLKFEDLSPVDAAVFVEHLTFEKINANYTKSVLYVNLIATVGEYIGRRGSFIKSDFRSGVSAEGPTLERDARMYLSATYLKPLRDAQNELSAGRGSRLSILLSSSKSIGGDAKKVDELIQVLITANQEIKKNADITSSRDEVEKLLKLVTFKADKFTPIIDMLASKELKAMSEVEKRFIFKSILERLTLGLDAKGQSHGLGYSNLLFMTAELLLLTKEGEGFPILLVEEPEAHLHPQLQMKFIQYLTTHQGLQCILSTHSPNLASKVSLDNLILMNKGLAFPMRKDCTLLEKDDYPFLEKFLDVTKANMFFAKSILLVEGPGENILLPTICELLGRPLEDYGVSIVNVGGLAYKRYAKIYRRTGATSPILPIKVGCITDLDIWPDKAEMKPNNPIGFIERKLKDKSSNKRGNENRWQSYHDADPEAHKNWVGTKKEVDGGCVKTFVSDAWTFEYCLAKYGLAEELCNAIQDGEANYEELSQDIEEKSIQIYSMIVKTTSGKTETAYRLIEILKKKYQDKPFEFKKVLPPYIVAAIEYVTEPINEPENTVEI